jgi:hypothetical protein
LDFDSRKLFAYHPYSKNIETKWIYFAWGLFRTRTACKDRCVSAALQVRVPRRDATVRQLRWVFLGLFVALVLALFLLPLTGRRDWGMVHWSLVLLLFFASQAVFIFGAGTWDLCRPVRKHHLWLPVTVAGAMFAALTGGFCLAVQELSRGNALGLWWLTLLGSWVIWGVLLWIYTYEVDRFRALHRMTTWLFLGSIAELLAAIPAHVMVIRRRPVGCLSFEGMWTGIAMMAGLVVMFWTLGPAVALLVLKNRYHRERTARRAQFRAAVSRPSPGGSAPSEAIQQ